MLYTHNSRYSFNFILFLISTLSIAACNPMLVGSAVPWWDPFVKNSHSMVQVVDVNKSSLLSGEISLAIKLRNKSTLHKQSAKFKVEWINSNGMPIHSVLSRWNSISLIPEESHTFTAVSPGNTATGFFLTVSD